MTDTVLNFSSNQSASNLLLSESDIDTKISAAITAAVPTFDNAVNYLAGDKVYYAGIYYVAPVNINLGGGTPLANTTWRQIPTWGSYTTTVSAASTTALDLYSASVQRISGSTTHTFTLPVTSTIPALGRPFYFINDSTGAVTVNSSGGNLVATVSAGQRTIVTCILLSGTTAASWTSASFGILPASGTNLTLSSYLNESKGADIASATTTDIGAATGNFVDVTGTTTITGLGTIQAGTRRIVRFTGALTLTHNATSLILPGGASITTVAGDTATFVSLGSGNWVCVNYQKKTITGTGSEVLATSPTLVTPVLGVATATSINKVAITSPATSATLTIADGKTATVNNSLTFAGTDSTTHTFPSTTSTLARTDAAQSFTGTQTFNNYVQLSESGGILMDQTLSADGTFSIAVGEIGTLGETLSFGHLVYFKAADSRWWKCDSDAEATSGPVKLGIVCVAGVAGDACQIMLKGKIRADSLFPTFTVGAPVYIGATAGACVVTAPTAGFIRVIGYGDTADSIYFNPDNFYYELGISTLTLEFNNASTGITYSSQSVGYVKSCNNLNVSGYIALTNKGSATGNAELTSFPFTFNNYGAAAVGYITNITYTGVFLMQIETGSTSVYFIQTTEAGTNSNLADTNFANTSAIIFSINIKV